MATLVILSRISLTGMNPWKLSAISPNKNTKDGRPNPQRIAELNPINRNSLSVESAKVSKIFL